MEIVLFSGDCAVPKLKAPHIFEDTLVAYDRQPSLAYDKQALLAYDRQPSLAYDRQALLAYDRQPLLAYDRQALLNQLAKQD